LAVGSWRQHCQLPTANCQLPTASEELAVKLHPLGSWLAAIVELSLLGLKTAAAATAAEITQFLAHNPAPQEFLDFHVSQEKQERLRRLLALNEAGLLSQAEQAELDELQRLEHLVIMLKAQTAQQLTQQP
jgi:hypothetical protein